MHKVGRDDHGGIEVDNDDGGGDSENDPLQVVVQEKKPGFGKKGEPVREAPVRVQVPHITFTLLTLARAARLGSLLT